MVFRELDLFAKLLPVAKIETSAQSVHLVSGVVYVVLALDLATAGLENVCEHIAYGGPPAVAYMERPGWVGADELHLDLEAVGDFEPSILSGIVQDLADNSIPRRRFDEKIDEARPGYLDLFEYGSRNH